MESGENGSDAPPTIGVKESALGGLAGDEAEAVFAENGIGICERFGGQAGGDAEEGIHDFEENPGAETENEGSGGNLEIAGEPEGVRGGGDS